VNADLGWRARSQDAPEIEDGDVVANAEDQIGMMLDQEHAGALAADLHDQAAQMVDLDRRQTRRGFVEQKKGGSQDQGPGDLDETQFAVLQAVGTDILSGFSTVPTGSDD
jgi:hypothetical protein